MLLKHSPGIHTRHSLQCCINGHTFGIPNHDCQVGILDVSSAIEICNGSGMRAEKKVSWLMQLGSFEHTLQIPHATVHSSVVAEP
jgi:hypothetical protein